MKPIKLEDATKSEIIRAIDREFAISDIRRRIEREVYHLRVQGLLAKLDQACADMEANRQTGETMDWSKHARWAKANDRWNLANDELSKLQGL